MTHSSPHAMFAQRFVLRHDDRQQIEQAETRILEALQQHGYREAETFGIRMALEEALTNAFKHGNKSDASKTVRLDCRIDEDALHFEIEDQGEGFDPDSVPDPTQEENMEIPSGRGLKLMRAFMTSVTIDPPGNRVCMSFVR